MTAPPWLVNINGFDSVNVFFVDYSHETDKKTYKKHFIPNEKKNENTSFLFMPRRGCIWLIFSDI